MKIELIYDPVEPATTVWVNDQVVDITDIYGFLYPVRNCLLQTWLYSSGSWQGLAQQLKELARGDDIALTFCGRREDCDDVKGAVAGVEGLSLSFRTWDSLPAYESAFQELDRLLESILDAAGEERRRDDGENAPRKTMAELYPEVVDTLSGVRRTVGDQWMVEIADEADYIRADQTAMSCCVVDDGYMDSYEKLEHLEGLTRSMRRSKDMICCFMPDEKRRKRFAAYAGQYARETISFLGGGLKAHKKSLYAKYGKAYLLRQRLWGYQRMLEVLEQCFQDREALTQRKRQLAAEAKPGISEVREQERIKIKINWLDRKSVYLTKMGDILRQLKAAGSVREGGWSE